MIKTLTERVDLFQFCVNNHALNGDALQVVEEINMGSKSLSRIGHFIEGIHHDVLCLRSSRFCFAPREANSGAHILAKEAAKLRICHV